jgi:translation initiation factor 4G
MAADFHFFDHVVIQVVVIFQIFDKALDEPKYSSMYAQLCKRLSEEAPNFEPPNSPCTFRLLLLNKCRTEFENRSKASEAFEHRDGPLAPEEEERRQLTKRKMLGNIKVCMFLSKYASSPIHIFFTCLILQEEAVGEVLLIWLQFSSVVVDL